MNIQPKMRHLRELRLRKLLEKAKALALCRVWLVCDGASEDPPRPPSEVRQSSDYKIVQAAHDQVLREIFESLNEDHKYPYSDQAHGVRVLQQEPVTQGQME